MIKKMKRRRLVAALSFALLALALLVASAQADTTKPQPARVKKTAKPILTLAMDGPRVAYMRRDRRVGVWNVLTGATSVIKGNYPNTGVTGADWTGEVAIAGKRVALITRFVGGNTWETNERLYIASLGGSARQLGQVTDHSSDPGDCMATPVGGGSWGNWVGGLVGSGKVLAVSRWNSNGTTTSGERLSLIVPRGARTIASGPAAIVSQSAGGGHIAVLRSTDAWPYYQGPVEQGTPLVGVYSSGGRLLGEIALDVALPPPCGYGTHVRIALSGNRLVVLRPDPSQPGSQTATVEVYNWTTGALTHTWPLPLNPDSPMPSRLAVYGRLAVIQGYAFELRLLDLTTGKAAAIAARHPGSPATIGSRGLVYAVNPAASLYKGPGKLVFLPTAKLLSILSH